MTEKLFYTDAYATKFTASILSCQKTEEAYYHIILDRTMFYPEGGGQPADQGVLGDATIFDVHEKNGEIIHYSDKPLEVGTEIEGEIDWARRFDLMQNHSGEHILSGIICEKYDCDNVGFHMGKDRITIDFNTQIDVGDFDWLEKRANEAIWNNTPLEIDYPSREDLKFLNYRSKIEILGEVRIVRAGEYDCCACCGTHVRSAGEIGMIKMIGAQNYKGGTRIELLCGKRALLHYGSIHNVASEVGRVLSVPEEKIEDAVNKLIMERDGLTQELKKWKWQFFLAKIERLPDDDENVLIVGDGLSGKDMTALADLVAEKNNGRAMVLTPSESGFAFVLVSRKLDAKEIAEELKKCFDCKGGGKEQAIQGKLGGNKEEIINYFKERNYSILN